MDPANGVTVSGFRIPAISTRRLETEVELAEGQSFVIAGLLDERVTEDLSRIPGLSHIPVLGALFRTRARTKGRTELVVVVTPESGSLLSIPLPQAPLPFLGPLPREEASPWDWERFTKWGAESLLESERPRASAAGGRK